MITSESARYSVSRLRDGLPPGGSFESRCSMKRIGGRIIKAMNTPTTSGDRIFISLETPPMISSIRYKITANSTTAQPVMMFAIMRRRVSSPIFCIASPPVVPARFPLQCITKAPPRKVRLSTTTVNLHSGVDAWAGKCYNLKTEYYISTSFFGHFRRRTI